MHIGRGGNYNSQKKEPKMQVESGFHSEITVF